jgi:hypothetical protein
MPQEHVNVSLCVAGFELTSSKYKVRTQAVKMQCKLYILMTLGPERCRVPDDIQS